MFDIGSSELLLIVVVAVVVIGPKDLPRVLYKVGQYVGKARAMTRHFRAGIDEMVRQAEIEDMEKKWAAQNARIMAESQMTAASSDVRTDAGSILSGTAAQTDDRPTPDPMPTIAGPPGTPTPPRPPSTDDVAR